MLIQTKQTILELLHSTLRQRKVFSALAYVCYAVIFSCSLIYLFFCLVFNAAYLCYFHTVGSFFMYLFR
jgi:hypothetical protein